jgi:hypothetical protein
MVERLRERERLAGHGRKALRDAAGPKLARRRHGSRMVLDVVGGAPGARRLLLASVVGGIAGAAAGSALGRRRS